MEHLPRAARADGVVRTGREAAVFIRRGEDFLLLHRAHERYWHIVAGVVEEGETFAEAAARELREEAGLDAPLSDLRLPQDYRIPAEQRAEYAPGTEDVAVENFWVEVPADWEPVLNEEHDDYRWCSLTDAISLAKWPETVEAIVLLGRPPTAPGSELAQP